MGIYKYDKEKSEANEDYRCFYLCKTAEFVVTVNEKGVFQSATHNEASFKFVSSTEAKDVEKALKDGKPIMKWILTTPGNDGKDGNAVTVEKNEFVLKVHLIKGGLPWCII